MVGAMSSTEPSDPRKELDDFSALCYHIGLALVTWQDVEDAHFKVFLQMLNVPLSDVSSVVYYSFESFEARRKMVSSMARYFLAGREFKKQRAYWQVLEKDLKDANENRNKLAHYQADYDLINQTELPDGGVRFDVTPHTLRPGRWNFVAKLLGRNPDSPEHNLSSQSISKYIVDFRSLRTRLDWFHVSIGPNGAAMAQVLSK
jgi:hypothetical protein